MKKLVSLIKNTDLTSGSVTGSIWIFAMPLIFGNILQQLYNIVDTVIVGRYLGPDALAAVGSSYSVMVLLTSVIIGLCMGSGVLFSTLYGAGDIFSMKQSFIHSFVFIGVITFVLQILALALLNWMLVVFNIPTEIIEYTASYLRIIFAGLIFSFIYNYFAVVLRAIGNSYIPLLFLCLSALLNILLDYLFIVFIGMGTDGAALATVLSQLFSGIGLFIYIKCRKKELIPSVKHMRFDINIMHRIGSYSLLTSIQQSIMNFGILMIQGLVNSYGVAVMAAFAAAVKIDSIAYMPVQDFGNAFSTFIAQNKGAGERLRIKKGLRSAVVSVSIFSIFISAIVYFNAEYLMGMFIDASEVDIIRIGVNYLRIEGACYIGIGCLFLFYGLYRGLGRAGYSIVLTVISLGTRVALSYLLSPKLGIEIIWWSIPIGWFLADIAGYIYFKKIKI